MARCRLSNVKRRIISKYLKGKYGYHLGEFSHAIFVVFGAHNPSEVYYKLILTFDYKRLKFKTVMYVVRAIEVNHTISITIGPHSSFIIYQKTPIEASSVKVNVCKCRQTFYFSWKEASVKTLFVLALNQIFYNNLRLRRTCSIVL